VAHTRKKKANLKRFTCVLGSTLFLASCGANSPKMVFYPKQWFGSSGTSTTERQRNGNVHYVRKGDTVYGIATAYNIPQRKLIEYNSLKPPYLLRINQKIYLPAEQTHTVQKGQNLYRIAVAYNLDINTLARANRIAPPYRLFPGDVLRIPDVRSDGTMATTPPVQAAASPRPAPSGTADISIASKPEYVPVPTTKPAVQASASGSKVASSAPSTVKTTPKPVQVTQYGAPKGAKIVKRPIPGVKPAYRPPVTVASRPKSYTPPPRSGRFDWPLRGKVISEFGPKGNGLHNDGINISASNGATVKAAETGVVAYAGNQLKGFGNLLLIKHANGYLTAYAHVRTIHVKRGQSVKKGQKIASVGQTGNVNTPQLHFELRRGSKPVDPMPYLQRKVALK
jgi:murein DD-endopeptidase MepM/ murein hydrolase activator NlpD